MKSKQGYLFQALLILLLVCDTSYSFYRYLEQPLDGDLAPIVLPHHVYQRVLDDPFGFRTFSDTTMYAGSNRYFAHAGYYLYFNRVPIILQKFLSPLDSIYIAAGLLRLFTHLILLLTISLYVRAFVKSNLTEFLWILLIASCFLQTGRLEPFFGLNQPSITYNTFYPLPMAILLLLFYPFTRKLKAYKEVYLSPTEHLICLVLLVVVSFSGSLMPAILILVVATFHLMQWIKAIHLYQGNIFIKTIRCISTCNLTVILYTVLILFIAAYSLYLSTFNIENTFDHLNLSERYERMPKGLWNMINANNAYPVWIVLYIISVYLINKKLPKETTRIWVMMANGILIFSLLYTVLLPCGGYRAYRAFIIRSDSFIPIITFCAILFSAGSILIMRYAIEHKNYFLLLIPLAFIVYYTVVDNSNSSTNYCERESIKLLQKSQEAITVIPYRCNLMGWIPMSDLTYSQSNSELLYRWHVTDTIKYYRHSTETK